ncbi:MAG: hypothetical protein ACM3XM_01235 [Mycobacterium leprae]
MAETHGKTLRTFNLFDPRDHRALWLDATAPGSVGPMAGLEEPDAAVEAASLVDGLILNPGPAERLSDRLPGKRGAGLLVRLDWTNAFRAGLHPLPPVEVRQVMLASADDALLIGAEGAVFSLLLGFDEGFEAACVQRMAQASRQCERAGLPFVVDVRLAGPRVTPAGFAGAVKLGAGFAVEGGADAVLLPDPGEEAWSTLMRWAPVPLLKRYGSPGDPPLDWDGLSVTAAAAVTPASGGGLCLGETLFARPDRIALLQALRAAVHPEGVQP